MTPLLDVAVAASFALLAWWASTGLILYLDLLPRRTFRRSMAGATLVAVAAVAGLAWSAGETAVHGAYVAFVSGLALWGWQEISFYMGYVAGPRPESCPPGAPDRERFVRAIQATLYHELACVAGAAVVVAATWEGTNQVGTWTYLLLWVMRTSAKLNMFLGVPNHFERFLPEHLRYLQTFFKRAPMNLLFPASVTAGAVGVVLLVLTILAGTGSLHETAGLTFLAVLLALAVLEHWFLVLPLSTEVLWTWSVGAAPKPAESETTTRTRLGRSAWT